MIYNGFCVRGLMFGKLSPDNAILEFCKLKSILEICVRFEIAIRYMHFYWFKKYKVYCAEKQWDTIFISVR